MLEKYQPDSEEIQKAEDSMTDQQAQMSKIREEGYHLGMVDAKKKKRKKW